MKRLLVAFVLVALQYKGGDNLKPLTPGPMSDNSHAPARDHAAIQYSSRPLHDPASQLKMKVESGDIQLTTSGDSGYLRSILDALSVPLDSQVVVFSKTSLQGPGISPDSPRSIFFNDSVAVAWTRGGFIELASVDPEQGPIFYTFGHFGKPAFERNGECLNCHSTPATLRVPGLVVGSVIPEADGTPVSGLDQMIVDHRSPFEQRWGGWYVTAKSAPDKQLGNRVVSYPQHPPQSLATMQVANLESLTGKFDMSGYLTPHSDIVALMVLEHQTHMQNLITRFAWEERVYAYDKLHVSLPTGVQKRLDDDAKEFVDYLLFVDEMQYPIKIEGTSGFTERFSKEGPRDRKGRSLHELDLNTRMMRYPCSYMIYSKPFDAMPAEVKTAIYKRMWEVLSGQEKDPKYARLSTADRRAIVEILRDTKRDLPGYFAANLVQ
jgi:hypothetical protein